MKTDKNRHSIFVGENPSLLLEEVMVESDSFIHWMYHIQIGSFHVQYIIVRSNDINIYKSIMINTYSRV